MRDLVPGQVPDPLRAHGAWVYLVVSILAGAIAVSGRGRVAALLAGAGFFGLIVLASSLAIMGHRGAGIRFLVGLFLSLGTPLLAFAFGADRSFLVVGLGAIPPAATAAWCAGARGFQSSGALSFGVSALIVAAPVAASAGGAPLRHSILLYVTLAPFFFWRTWRLARALGPGWTQKRLKQRGLIESAVAVVWAAAAVVATRMLG